MFLNTEGADGRGNKLTLPQVPYARDIFRTPLPSNIAETEEQRKKVFVYFTVYDDDKAPYSHYILTGAVHYIYAHALQHIPDMSEQEKDNIRSYVILFFKNNKITRFRGWDAGTKAMMGGREKLTFSQVLDHEIAAHDRRYACIRFGHLYWRGFSYFH